jgi:hypothetical protein
VPIWLNGCKFSTFGFSIEVIPLSAAIQRKQFFECVFISGMGKGKAVASGSNLLPSKLSQLFFVFA